MMAPQGGGGLLLLRGCASGLREPEGEIRSQRAFGSPPEGGGGLTGHHWRIHSRNTAQVQCYKTYT